MKISIALIAIALLSGCAHQDRWTGYNTALELTWQAANIADGIQTSRIHENPLIEEKNAFTVAILGRQPDPTETAMYFATLGISHFLISRMLPREWREFYQTGTAIYQVSTVYQNCQIDGC